MALIHSVRSLVQEQGIPLRQQLLSLSSSSKAGLIVLFKVSIPQQALQWKCVTFSAPGEVYGDTEQTPMLCAQCQGAEIITHSLHRRAPISQCSRVTGSTDMSKKVEGEVA